MENDKWKMSRAKPARFYLSFIIFRIADIAETQIPHEQGLFDGN